MSWFLVAGMVVVVIITNLLGLTNFDWGRIFLAIFGLGLSACVFVMFINYITREVK